MIESSDYDGYFGPIRCSLCVLQEKLIVPNNGVFCENVYVGGVGRNLLLRYHSIPDQQARGFEIRRRIRDRVEPRILQLQVRFFCTRRPQQNFAFPHIVTLHPVIKSDFQLFLVVSRRA